MDANINIEVQDSVVTEAVSESSLETDINTVTVPTKAALKKTVMETPATKSLKTGSELQTIVQEQQQNQANTTQSVGGHVSSGLEIVTLDGAVEESDRQVRDPAGERLQSDDELPGSLHQIEDRLKQQREIDKGLGNQDNTVERKGDWVNEEETEPNNLGLECSAVITTEVKDAFSSSIIITLVSPAKVCSVSYDSEHECQQQKAGDDLLEAHDLSAQHTGMYHKQNMDTPMLQKEVPSTVDSDIWRDSKNNKHQHDSDQDVDQMVPTNCQTTTALLVSIPVPLHCCFL